MAGGYPDAPGHRMAWDEDGSVGIFWRNDGALQAIELMSQANMTEMNDEDDTSVDDLWMRAGFVGCIFPELRDVYGAFWARRNAGHRGEVDTSADSVDGWGGTWTTQIAASAFYTETVQPAYWRTEIDVFSENAQRAIRMYYSNGSAYPPKAMHIYGEIAAGETPDRLLYVDATTGLEFTTMWDFGAVPRGSARDDTFRLKNNSSTLTASSIQVLAESLFGSSGSWFTFSEGGSFVNPLSLAASIVPTAQSPTLTARQVVPSGAGLGPQAPRFQTTATWS